MIIFNYKNLIEGKIVNRPSKTNKSPYLADVMIDNKLVMSHSPALGMSGMINPSVISYSEYIDNEKCVSKYRLRVILLKNFNNKKRKIYLGANPVLANKLVLNSFIYKQVMNHKKLKNISSNCFDWKAESKILDSRIDFKTTDGKNTVYIEVKNVPLASYTVKEVKTNKLIEFYGKKRKLFINMVDNKKYGVFPDGYTKKNSDVVSERAYKHLLTLEKISKMKNHRSILIFVIQRNDCDYFVPNYIRDPKYSNKLKLLVDDNIIECYVMKFGISKRGKKFNFKFIKFLPLILDFNEKFDYLSINNKKLNPI